MKIICNTFIKNFQRMYSEVVFSYNGLMKNDERKAYSTDLTDSQWAIIAPLFKGMFF